VNPVEPFLDPLRRRSFPGRSVPNLLLVLVVLIAATRARAQTLADVPGRVLYWRESPDSVLGYGLPPGRIYTTSPSIAVLPGGEYLVTFNLFGDDLLPPAETSGTTFVYRSSDRGETWTNLTPVPMTDLKRGSLFTFGGAAWLWGYTAAPGKIVIRKSTDAGSTWTVPTTSTTGLLANSTFGGTPHDPVIHGGRLWTAVGGKRVMSVSTTRDFLDASRWAGPSDAANTDTGPFGDGLLLSEAQIVASPATGVVVLPKVDGIPATAIVRVTGNAAVADPAPSDWVALPGGDKKFAVSFDPVSARFWLLSNPVLPAHDPTPGLAPQLVRNTATISSSPDLVHWDVEKIFLYSANVSWEAFQYFNFDFDGDDLAVVSRTGFDLTGEPGVDFRPPRGHDSNLITFHRIEGFRTSEPDQFVEIAGGVARRRERTLHESAPLGPFALGVRFAGHDLGAVDGIANGAPGEVLLRETGGRVLRFDRLGVFLGVGSAAGVVFGDRLDPAPAPPAGERAWTRSSGGRWEDLAAWFYWNRPDTTSEIASFGSSIATATTVSLDQEIELAGLRLRSDAAWTIAGSGGIALGGTSPFVEANRGAHSVEVPVVLSADAAFSAAAGSAVALLGGLDLATHELDVSGAGIVRVGGSLSTSGGVLRLAGDGRLRLAAGTEASLGGTLEWIPSPTTALSPGAVFPLLDGLAEATVTGAFETVVLPDLPAGLSWDTSELYADGSVRVAVVCELACAEGSATCTAPFACPALVPGGGPASVDCAAEWFLRPAPAPDRRGRPDRRLSCRDGDPSCDGGPAGDGTCTFDIALCLNVADSRLDCSPADVAETSVRAWSARREPEGEAARAAVLGAIASLGAQPANTCAGGASVACWIDADCDSAPGRGDGRCRGRAVFLPPTAAAACSRPVQVEVAARASGRPGWLKISLATRGSGASSRTDADLLTLSCEP